LPAGVLLYMVIANIFQGLQTFLLSRESLPDNLQKILDDQLNQQDKSTVSIASEVISDSDRLPFEPKSNK
jgi:YidC/Oxa1 family membrane protein insertase